jgi:L-ascorbate metabolism protein UlaG (beta-lactamase superfamily)
MKFTYYGHACFSITMNEKILLFDPFIKQNEAAKAIDINSIAADYILLSHAHFDHTADAIEIANRTGAKIIASWEVANWAEKNGIKNTHPMNPGGQFSFDFGKVRCTTAQHSSSFQDGSYGGNPMGFLITNHDGESVYYAGDTALTLDMQLIPHFTHHLKAAILPIGDNFTMGYEDAAIAASFCKTNKVIAVHFDTFGYIKIDHAKVKAHFKDKHIAITLPEIGQSFDI